MTKRYRLLTWVFGIFSVLLNICPVGVYIIKTLVEGSVVVEKVALACTVFVVLIMSAVAWINKTTLRSRVWVLCLGLYFCLDTFVEPIILIAVTQVLDEWIISPLWKYYKTKLSINREIDKRGF